MVRASRGGRSGHLFFLPAGRAQLPRANVRVRHGPPVELRWESVRLVNDRKVLVLYRPFRIIEYFPKTSEDGNFFDVPI